MWLRLLQIKLDLLLLNDQYAEIKVTEGTRGPKKIKTNLKDQEEEDNRSMNLKATSTHPSTLCKAISLKADNQRSIALAHNLVYHTQTKHNYI